MGTRTSRLKLFKPDPTPDGIDPVDVELDLEGNYDLLDDHAMIRVRADGVFPSSSESYQGEMLYHQATGRIYTLWDDNQWRTFKRPPAYVGKKGAASKSVPDQVDTIIDTWGAAVSTSAMDFQADGFIKFKQTGLYYVSATLSITGPNAVYEQFLAIRMQNNASVDYARFASSDQSWNSWKTVGGFVRIGTTDIGFKAGCSIWQNSGSAVNYNLMTTSRFYAVRIGGHYGD